jgi:hypothetical protein
MAVLFGNTEEGHRAADKCHRIHWEEKTVRHKCILASFYCFFFALVRVGKVLCPHRQVPVLQEFFLPVVSVFGIRRIYTQSWRGEVRERLE